MNSPHTPPSDQDRNPASAPASAPARIAGGRKLTWFFGVILPVVALGTELSTGMARGWIDPVPTLAHAALIALVPVAHLLGLLALGAAARRPSLRLASRLNAAALAVSLAYAALFAPVTPFAFVGILAFGFGLLPLAPLGSLITGLCLRHALKREGRRTGRIAPSFWPGFAAPLLVLALLEAPASVVTYGVRELAAADSARAEAGPLRLLRTLAPLGGEDVLLRGAHERLSPGLRRQFFDLCAGGRATAEAYQLAYYRATGRAFSAVPAPAAEGLEALRMADAARDRGWDGHLGDQQVGRKLTDLAVRSSRIDATVEPAAALAYAEWTLEFRNDHAFDQREARAVIQLPPGAVVSRLTLWVHGEEREAAWGGRAQVVEAYRSVVVVQRRDPVLVTHHGPDRVLMQCFPIEPRGGVMKVRLGFTTPLIPDESARGHLLLPRFIEQNFQTPADLTHQVWVESTSPLTSDLPGLARAESPSNHEPGAARYTLQGGLGDSDFSASAAPASVALPPADRLVWTPALRDPSRVVTQTLRRAPAPSGPLVLVLSGSAELVSAGAILADQLARTDPTPFTRIYVAGDQLATSPADLTGLAQAEWLRARPFVGGQDDGPALAEALDALAARGGGTLVWLHGGQPLAWRDTAALEQRLARRAGLVRVLAVPVHSAPHVLLEKIAATPTPLETFPRLGALPADLARLQHDLTRGRLVPMRKARSAEGFVPTGPRASDHLSRLHTRDEVYRLLEAGMRGASDAARELALAAQLVTPVSGAVVLETQAQYDAAGLAAAPAQNSPNIPEPATYGLVLSASLLVFTLLRRRRRPVLLLRS